MKMSFACKRCRIMRKKKLQTNQIRDFARVGPGNIFRLWITQNEAGSEASDQYHGPDLSPSLSPPRPSLSSQRGGHCEKRASGKTAPDPRPPPRDNSPWGRYPKTWIRPGVGPPRRHNDRRLFPGAGDCRPRYQGFLWTEGFETLKLLF